MRPLELSLKVHQKIYTVSELTYEIKSLIEEFRDILLEGEVSNVRIPPSGHIFFTLKDENAQIRAVIFRNTSIYLPYLPQEGQKVIVMGRLSVYEKKGDYRIIVDELVPKGIGELQRRFEELKRKLEREGLFDKSFKKEIPAYPRKIGVITSPSGAAIRDIINVLSRRFPAVPVLLFPVHVQGERAVGEIVRALDYMSEREDVDVIILGRGGGSIEDLWAFNEEEVARAIFRCKKPIISAVGHEIDYTIADYVADKRAPTPSAAAEMVVRDRKEVALEIRNHIKRAARAVIYLIEREKRNLEHLRRRLRDPVSLIDSMKMRYSELYDRMVLAVEKLIKNKKGELNSLHRLMVRASPTSHIKDAERRVTSLRGNLILFMERKLEGKRAALQGLSERLRGLDPRAVLKRGYAIVKKDGKVIHSSKEVELKDRIEVLLGEGSLGAEVIWKDQS